MQFPNYNTLIHISFEVTCSGVTLSRRQTWNISWDNYLTPNIPHVIFGYAPRAPGGSSSLFTDCYGTPWKGYILHLQSLLAYLHLSRENPSFLREPIGQVLNRWAWSWFLTQQLHTPFCRYHGLFSSFLNNTPFTGPTSSLWWSAIVSSCTSTNTSNYSGHLRHLYS